MKKIVITICVFVICLFCVLLIPKDKSKQYKGLSKQEKIKALINISDLSDEFMNNYYNDYAEMSERGNLDNVLIVISDREIKNTYGATDIVYAPNNNYYLQYETEKDRKNALKKLKADNYLSVEENQKIELPDEDNATEYMSWGIEAMGLDYAIEEANKRDLADVTVAIIDTGLDINIYKNYFPQSKIAGGYSALSTNPNDAFTDIHSHGTHIAGTISEGTPDNVKIFVGRAGEASFSLTDTINVLNYILDNNAADVINMSLGGYGGPSAEYEQAIDACAQNNVIVVAASGNLNTSYSHYPASSSNTISVASVTKQFEKASASNYDDTVTFTGPGSSVLSINGTKSGTSMSTPHVASAVAIIKGYNKNISLNDSIDILKTTTDDLGDYGWDPYYGYGFINFRNREFCDGTICDKYNVFKTDEVEVEEVVKIEADDIYVPKYNYGNITNIMGAKLRIYYNDTEYVTKSLGELDDIEIEGYEPNNYSTQNVNISYKNKSTILEVNNETNTQSGWVYESIDENNIKITGFLYVDEIAKVYIPNKIDNYDVTTLGDSLFENNIFIRSIIVSDNIVNVGNSTFKNTKIEKIAFKSNTINAGNYAFYDAKDLKNIVGVVNHVGEYAFANCHSLDNVVLSDNLKRIENYAFANDQLLQNINIPSSLTYIGEYAFAKTKISSVTIPSGVVNINEGAFNECYNLSNLVLSNGVKTIGEYAFQNTVLTSLEIPKSVESIASKSFSNLSFLRRISVDSNNNYYKSVNNLLIEKESNKLMVGTSNYDGTKYTANIPSSVKIINSGAFAKRFDLTSIKIPEGVTTIEDGAFYYCKDLTSIEIPESVTTIGSEVFHYTNSKLVGKIYYNSPAREMIDNLNKGYITVDPFEVNVSQIKTEYKAFESVDVSNLSLELHYLDKQPGYNPTVRLETINSDYEIKYIDGQSLKYGDTYFTIEATTATGYKLSHNVEVTVSKIKPNYEVPSNIRGNYGQKLSDIVLPSGFEWMNPNEVIDNSETQTYKARYVPNDTNNYEIVENIDIPVSVGKQVINPEIIINDKIYDGTNNIDNSLISISNMDSKDYTVISATITNPNVGVKDAKVVIRLSDDKYNNCSFDGDLQEKEFIVNMNVIPESLIKPVLEDREYIYNGTEQEVSIINYNNNKMNISGNTRTKAGTQKITISLKNNNYIWEDGTTEDIKYDFVINKADINLVDNSKDVEAIYDGNNHTIDYNIESSLNIVVRYMDTNGDFTLSEIPKYKDIGSYVVKYKVSIDDNYNEYYNEKSLNILIGEIVNNTVDYEGYFNNSEHTLDIKTNVSNYDIKYSSNTDYNLNEIPKYKDIGEYTINYKITKLGYNDLIGSNRVRIYGIRGFDSSVKVKNELLITSDFTFDELISKTDIYANTINYEHYNKNSELISDSGIKTKDKIKIILNNDKPFVYSIVLLGDTDGDGEINYLDYVNVYNHIQKVKHPESNKKLLENEYLQAADMSLDDEIDYMDYVGIYNRIKELKGGGQ